MIRFPIVVAFHIASLFSSLASGAQNWEGSWGDPKKGTVTFRHCSDTQCDFILRTNEKIGGHCSMTGRLEKTTRDGIMSPSSAGFGEAYKAADNGCRIKVHLIEHGIQADQPAGACELYCNKFKDFPRLYPLISSKPLNDDNRCFTNKSPSWTAWCTNETFSKQDSDILDKIVAAQEKHPGFELEDDGDFVGQVVKSCETNRDPLACLHEKYGARERETISRIESLETKASSFLKDAETPGDEAKADLAISKLEGVYKNHFKNSTVDGEKYQSENILEVVRVSKTSIYFKTHLEFFNGHQCNASGLAKYSKLNNFIYKDSDEGSKCLIAISADEKNIRLDDQHGKCSDSCGARGSLQDVKFPLNQRRPIKYMKILKSSSDYRKATE